MARGFDRALLPAAPNLEFEARLWCAGASLIGGVDEAGRGALAGPVAAGVLILPPDSDIEQRLYGMLDSKKLNPSSREHYFDLLVEVSLAFGVGFASNKQIDAIGIVPATRLAIQKAIEQLDCQPDYLLVDFIDLPDSSIQYTSIVKGDERSLSIAGASILAKVARDELMRKFDDQYPGYDFSAHKGYGTPSHRAAMKRLGTCPIHRMSFDVAL